jgi:hypothetical protein
MDNSGDQIHNDRDEPLNELSDNTTLEAHQNNFWIGRDPGATRKC